jgi:hypothetical protein
VSEFALSLCTNEVGPLPGSSMLDDRAKMARISGVLGNFLQKPLDDADIRDLSLNHIRMLHPAE